MPKPYLPINQKDLQERSLSQLDFIFVTPDAYVDHPSFAVALLGRFLEKNGYSVGVIAQPDWKNTEAFTVLGKPRLAFLISGGAMDSMVANYTANNKPRSEDNYSHGGEKGRRPDRAVITYCAKIKEAYKGVPLIIGGIEASLRRFGHYDYWSNTIKHSILLDSKADLLIYGMGEKPLLEIAQRLNKGETAAQLRGIRGTMWRTGKLTEIEALKADHKTITLPSFQEISANTPEGKSAYAASYLLQEQNTDPVSAHVIIEQSESRFVVQEKPSLPLTQSEYDELMELPFTRTWHPVYDKPASNGKVGIPALQEVLFSLTSCRGCFGACSFCAITFHQGKRIQTRSHESLVKEAKLLTQHPEFKGYIHDVGGPTANFRHNACSKQEKFGACTNRECLGDTPCPNIEVDHTDYIQLLRKIRAIPHVKKVFIRSGIRFDYVMLDKDSTFLEELCSHHVSGQLKVAPEHVSNKVLKLIRKSTHETYRQFAKKYHDCNKKLGKKQYLVPYYIAGLPGADLNDAIEVALYLKEQGFVPDQVQDFYPTPGNLATTMYYTELDPHSKNEQGQFKAIYVPKGGHERRLQRALLQFNKKENQKLVKEALILAKREDLLGILR